MIDKPTINELAKCKDDITNETPMPFGKYKGVPCGELPFHYIQYLYDEDWVADEWPKLFEYVLDRLEEAGEPGEEWGD